MFLYIFCSNCFGFYLLSVSHSLASTNAQTIRKKLVVTNVCGTGKWHDVSMSSLSCRLCFSCFLRFTPTAHSYPHSQVHINVEKTIHRDKSMSDLDSVSDRERMFLERERERNRRLGLDIVSASVPDSMASHERDRSLANLSRSGDGRVSIALPRKDSGLGSDSGGSDVIEVMELPRVDVGSEGSASSIDGDGESQHENMKGGARSDSAGGDVQEVDADHHAQAMGVGYENRHEDDRVGDDRDRRDVEAANGRRGARVSFCEPGNRHADEAYPAIGTPRRRERGSLEVLGLGRLFAFGARNA